MVVRDITFEEGFIVVTKEGGGPPSRTAIADVLRAADIPVLTIDKLTVLTQLADLFTTLVKTLIERGVIDENFADGYDWNWFLEVLESNLNSTTY